MNNKIIIVDKKQVGRLSSFAERIIPHLNIFILQKAITTRIYYSKIMGDFLMEFDDKLLALKPSQIQEWLMKSKTSIERVKPTSYAQRMTVIRSLYKVLMNNDLINSNPTTSLSSTDCGRIYNKHNTAVPTKDAIEVLAMLESKGTNKALRDIVILKLGLNQALRRSEIANLKLSDYNNNEGTIKVVGKGGRIDEIKLNSTEPNLIKWLEVRKGINNSSPYLFFNLSNNNKNGNDSAISPQSIFDLVRAYFKSKEISPHSLRSRSITDSYINSGNNLHVAQAIARHENPNTTEKIYIQIEKQNLASMYQPKY